jgi:hypothetical protein
MPLVAAARTACSALPSLSGSAAQIRWAQDIRQKLLASVDRYIREASNPTSLRDMEQTRAWLVTQTSAAWWIDNRNYKPTTVRRVRNREVLSMCELLLGPRKPVRRAL